MIKLGIVGAGWIAGQHLEVIKNIENVEAAGITSRTRSKALDLAEKYEMGFVADSIDSLVEKSSPDALLILVSPDQVSRVSLDAMKHKLPLFIEKPAGLTPAENLQLKDSAEKHSILTMVGYNRRFYSVFHKGIDIIKKHGPLMGIFIEGHERMWRVRGSKKHPDNVLDKWIFANSTHTIDLLRFFGGEANNVKHISHKYSEITGDQFAAIMETESGAIGCYNAYWYSPGGWRAVLYGNGVTVDFNPLEKGVWIDRDFNVHEIAPDEEDVKYKPGFYNQMKAFARMVAEGKKQWPAADLGDSYKTMLIAKEMSKVNE